MKRRVLLLCALKVRDLPALVLIKKWLEKNGVHCDILPAHANLRLIRYYPVDLVIFPHLFTEEFAQMAAYKKKQGAIIGVMGTEQYSVKEDYLRTSYSAYKEYLQLADIFFSWSNTLKTILVNNNILASDKVKVVGCPRFDFYFPEFANKLCNRNRILKKYNINQDAKNIIVWATGYGWIDLKPEYAIQKMKEAMLDKIIEPSYLLEIEKKAREEAIKNFFYLADKFRDVEFLIKIHPSELNTKIYAEQIKKTGLTNVKIIRMAELLELIYISDAWLHWNSTTAMEAGVMNKPTFNLAFGPAKNFLNKKLGSIIVYNEKDLENNLNLIFKNKFNPDKKYLKKSMNYAKKWIGNEDGKSIQKHVGIILEMLKNKNIKLSLTASFNPIYLLIKAYFFFKRLMGFENHESLIRAIMYGRTMDERGKFVSKKDIKNMELAYGDIL